MGDCRYPSAPTQPRNGSGRDGWPNGARLRSGSPGKSPGCAHHGDRGGRSLRRRDPGLAAGRDHPAQRPGDGGPGRGSAHGPRHSLPHRLHDQADHLRGRPDADGGRCVQAGRPDHPLGARVQGHAGPEVRHGTGRGHLPSAAGHHLRRSLHPPRGPGLRLHLDRPDRLRPPEGAGRCPLDQHRSRRLDGGAGEPAALLSAGRALPLQPRHRRPRLSGRSHRGQAASARC